MDFKKIALSLVVAFSVCSLSAQAQSQCSKKCDKAPNEQVEKGKQCDKAGKACDEKAEKACDKQAGSCCKKQEKACTTFLLLSELYRTFVVTKLRAIR